MFGTLIPLCEHQMPPAACIQIIFNWKYINYGIFNLSASFLVHFDFNISSRFDLASVWFRSIQFGMFICITIDTAWNTWFVCCAELQHTFPCHSWSLAIILFWSANRCIGHLLRQWRSRVIWIWHGWVLSMQLTSLITLCVQIHAAR